MNIETLVTILVVSAVAAILARLFSGFTLAGVLTSYLLACMGGVGGWLLQQRLGLPEIYTFRFSADVAPVGVVWPALGALVAALVGGLLWRPARSQRRSR